MSVGSAAAPAGSALHRREGAEHSDHLTETPDGEVVQLHGLSRPRRHPCQSTAVKAGVAPTERRSQRDNDETGP